MNVPGVECEAFCENILILLNGLVWRLLMIRSFCVGAAVAVGTRLAFGVSAHVTFLFPLFSCFGCKLNSLGGIVFR